MVRKSEFSLGAAYLGEGRTRFCVWAPSASELQLRMLQPQERIITLDRLERGYHQVTLEGIEPGSLYFYRIDRSKERPDPASRFQPQGVHGPSGVVDSSFNWKDTCWFGLPLQDYIIYEIHPGTFTQEATFQAIIPFLDGLKALGITAIEIMPVAQFPGGRNWGYDGVYPFAVQGSYGGPDGLRHLVNACHERGLAVVLDVIYNHLGPEGNYLAEFGPYFTERYRTPWGAAVNFDGADCGEVRRYFIENALYWITDFHIDSLRLDAVHAIYDNSPRTFLQELVYAVHQRSECLSRRAYLIAESNQNDVRLIRPEELGGCGLDAQWNDDFHHSVHVLLTGEQSGYYEDYGEFRHLVKAFREGFVYSGDYSRYRRRVHGSSSRDVPLHRMVVFAQNHDQIGNRMLGERLSRLVSFEDLKLAAGTVLLSPFIPLLFMGEEYGETAPFLYFTSHSDAGLVEAVRQGRRDEFAAFHWEGEIPDPQSDFTFQRCKLNRDLMREETNSVLRGFYKELICLRKTLPGMARPSKERMEVSAFEKEMVLSVRRWDGGEETLTIFSMARESATVTVPLPPGRWRKILDSADPCWAGPGGLAPQEIVSSGEAALSIRGRSFAVFAARG